MNDIKILLYTQDATPIEYDVSYIDEIPISFNFLISDIRNPDKKNASFSKTITFPGTKDINKFFELIWKSNISLNYFNPNKKCDIYYYVNSVLQFKGDLQLIKINVDDSSGEVVYECSCKGTIGNVFTKIADNLLSNPDDTSFTNCLNFSTYNHNLTFNNVTNSWATSIQVAGSPVSFALGNGYVYPLIDYGNQVMPSSGNTLPVADRDFEIKYFRPAIYKKTILDKIFSDAGYTYTSTFFNSTFYKSQIIPTSGDKFEKTAQQLIDNQFYVGRSSDFTVGPYNAGLNPPDFSFNLALSTTNTILFNATTSPYNNAAGKYNSANGKFTTTYAAYKYVNYNIEAVINLDFKIAYTSPNTATYVKFMGNKKKIFYNIKVNNIVLAFEEFEFDTTVFYPLNIGNIERKISLPAFALYGGKDVKVDIGWDVQYQFFNSSYGLVIASASNMRAEITSAKTYFSGNYVNTNIDEDDAVDLNKVLPINIKQIDWLMSEFKLHNLYMVQDKDNELNYFIEDRENFYSGSIDWSDKRDYSMKREVLPIGELDFLKYELEYKEDSDYLNDKYQKDYKESFGKHIEYVDNDFITQTKDVSVIYSGTPLKGNYINGLVIPTIYKVESGAISPIQSNIRSLYYGGLIAMNYGSWKLWYTNGNTSTTYTTYPFAGDCDNPYNPTLTLNWDTPHEVYYTYPQATYTDNNLYNRFYSRMINQLTDKSSKIERRYYNLTAYDIKNFDFRNVIFDDGYYIVNAIKDYNFMKPQSTMVELLKLTDYAVFVGNNNIDFNGGDAGGDGMVLSQMQNLSSANGSNINFGYNSNIVGGDNNFVASGANSVTLTNSNNVVIESSVSNFTGVNLTANSTITSGGINLSDAITIDNSSGSYLAKVNASQLVKKSITITANYTIDGSCTFFYVSAIDGNVKITIDATLFIDYEFTFFRTDSSANTVKLYGVASETLNGLSLPQTIITGQYSIITIKSNATNVFII
jgi:hypothetical protein